jgi:hypothetical protein
MDLHRATAIAIDPQAMLTFIRAFPVYKKADIRER